MLEEIVYFIHVYKYVNIKINIQKYLWKDIT